MMHILIFFSRRGEFSSGLVEGRILGDDRFIEEVLQKANQERHPPKKLDEIILAVCQYFGVSLEEVAAIGTTKPHSVAR